MSEVPIPGGGGLQHDLEGILGRSAVAVEPLIRLSSPDDPANPPTPPLVVLLPRDVPRRPQRPGWIAPAAVCAGVLLAAAAGLVVVRSRDHSAPAPVAAPVTTAADGSTAPATTTVVPATTTTIAPAAAVALEPRSALYADGKVYLRGAVPDEATARTIVERAGAVVGPANVVDEYVVDPGASRTDSGPLRIADTVQFAAGSAQLATEFRGLLDLGVVLLQRFPNVTITVLGHTDGDGDAAANQVLSQRRVDAVVAYLTKPGIDTSRVIGVARGEAEPLAGNDTPEGRRLNRRIEFVITGLLEG